MATKRKTTKPPLNYHELDKRLAIVESTIKEHDETLNDISTSMKALQTTINRWSGALLVATPLVAFFGTILGQKFFQ